MTSLQRSVETTVVSGIILAMLLSISAWSWGGWQSFNGNWFSNWHNPLSYQYRWFPPWHRPTPPLLPSPHPDPIGTISGTVSIGPLCPIEPCPYPRPNSYIGRSVVITPESPSVPVAYAQLSSTGTFSRTVPAGRYVITLVPCAELGCRNTLPKMAVVPANGVVQVTIDIDTGIR